MRPSMTRLRSLAPPNPISKAGTTRVRTTWSSTALRRRERGTPRCLSQHSVGQLGFARSRHAVTSKSSPDLCTIRRSVPRLSSDFGPCPGTKAGRMTSWPTGVHGGSWMVEAAWGEDAIHHAGKRVRERLQRDLKGTLGERLLKQELFYWLEEAKVLIEQWRWRR